MVKNENQNTIPSNVPHQNKRAKQACNQSSKPETHSCLESVLYQELMGRIHSLPKEAFEPDHAPQNMHFVSFYRKHKTEFCYFTESRFLSIDLSTGREVLNQMLPISIDLSSSATEE